MSKNQRGKGKKTQHVLDRESLSLMRLVEMCRYADIELAARRILEKRPNHHFATKALSFALIGLARFEEAVPLLNYALARWPKDDELHNNRGIVLSSLMRWDEALSNFEESLRLAPDDPEVLKNLGLAYSRMRRWNDAVPPLLKAIEAYPDDYVAAIELLSMALANCGRRDEAAICYRQLWESKQDPRYLYELFSINMWRNDWEGMNGCVEELRKRSSGFAKLLGNPFVSLFAPGVTAVEQKLIAETFSIDFVPGAVFQEVVPNFEVELNLNRRLRIGYVSADYRQHPVGFVFPEVIEQHDRGRIEVIGYSIGHDDGSDIRKRLTSAFDVFVDAHGMTVRELAKRIRSDKIDIVVDLNGWTTDSRSEVFALRCAPIQVSWLGYAGTMGHPRFADYLIGDRIVTPPERQYCYTETLALMPECYLPIDATPDIPKLPSRTEAGLPEDAFVYCSFNSAYKLNPEVFDLWCQILKDTPGSCLWLASPPEGGAPRLRAEASARGVEAERIVFARRLDTRIDHFARLALADLALDPFPYNSHSTGADMLFAGVPMLSLLGDTFPGRVGASLLHAVRQEQMVVQSVDEYYQLAVSLFRDRDRLSKIRASLIKESKRCLPLFDMKEFSSALEGLYAEMWKTYVCGRSPQLIDGRALVKRERVNDSLA